MTSVPAHTACRAASAAGERCGRAASSATMIRCNVAPYARRRRSTSATPRHRAGEIAARAAFSLDELSYEYPSENAPGENASQRLARLAEAGLHWRYPEGPPDKARAQMATL